MKYLKLSLLLLISLTNYSLSTSTSSKTSEYHTIGNQNGPIIGHRFLSLSKNLKSELDLLLAEMIGYDKTIARAHLSEIGSYIFDFYGEAVISKALEDITSFSYQPQQEDMREIWSVYTSSSGNIMASLDTDDIFYKIAFDLTYLKIYTQWLIYKLQQEKIEGLIINQDIILTNFKLYDYKIKLVKRFGSYAPNKLYKFLEFLKTLDLGNYASPRIEINDFFKAMKIINKITPELFKMLDTVFSKTFHINFTKHSYLKALISEDKELVDRLFKLPLGRIKGLTDELSLGVQKGSQTEKFKEKSSKVNEILKLFKIKELNTASYSIIQKYVEFLLTDDNDYFTIMFEQIENEKLKENFFSVVKHLYKFGITDFLKVIIIDSRDDALTVQQVGESIDFLEIMIIDSRDDALTVQQVGEFINLFKGRAGDLESTCMIIQNNMIQNNRIDELYYLDLFLENSFNPTMENQFEVLDKIDLLAEYFVAPFTSPVKNLI
jgi:hypothetical protein